MNIVKLQAPSMEYFKRQGLIRKTIGPDENCLFAAIAEMIYKTQTFHGRVRSELYDYLTISSADKSMDFSFYDYLHYLKNGKSFGGFYEIDALSRLYKRYVIVYVQHGYRENNYEIRYFGDPLLEDNEKKIIRLVYTMPCFFDLLYPLKHVAKMAISQAIIYEILYTKVFKYDKECLNATVKAMLKDKLFAKLKRAQNTSTKAEYLKKIKSNPKILYQLNDGSITAPFSYRVAKSLDPEMYRNVELDVWLDDFKEKYPQINY